MNGPTAVQARVTHTLVGPHTGLHLCTASIWHQLFAGRQASEHTTSASPEIPLNAVLRSLLIQFNLHSHLSQCAPNASMPHMTVGRSATHKKFTLVTHTLIPTLASVTPNDSHDYRVEPSARWVSNESPPAFRPEQTSWMDKQWNFSKNLKRSPNSRSTRSDFFKGFNASWWLLLSTCW